MNIFDNVAEAARNSGMSVYALEKAAGFSHGTIAKWRDVSPRVDNLLKVASVLNVDINDLTEVKDKGCGK